MSWAEVQKIKEACGIAPSFISNPVAVFINGHYELTWGDPSDTIISGQLFSTWGGVKIIRKEGEYPQTAFDGFLVADIKERNLHIENPLIDDEEIPGDIFYYAAFPYSNNGAIATNYRNQFIRKPQTLFGFKWDKTSYDPYGSITYLFDAIGKSPATGGNLGTWGSEWFIRDLRLGAVDLNGNWLYDLIPSDVTRKSDTSTSDYNGTRYDLNFVSGLPIVYWRWDEDERYNYFLCSNVPFEGSICPAHTDINGIVHQYRYLSIWPARPGTDENNGQIVWTTGNSTGYNNNTQATGVLINVIPSEIDARLANTSPNLELVCKKDIDIIWLLSILIGKNLHIGATFELPFGVTRQQYATEVFGPQGIFYLKHHVASWYAWAPPSTNSYIYGGVYIGGMAVGFNGDNLSFYTKGYGPYTQDFAGYTKVNQNFDLTSRRTASIIASESYISNTFILVDGMLIPRVSDGLIEGTMIPSSENQFYKDFVQTSDAFQGQLIYFSKSSDHYSGLTAFHVGVPNLRYAGIQQGLNYDDATFNRVGPGSTGTGSNQTSFTNTRFPVFSTAPSTLKSVEYNGSLFYGEPVSTVAAIKTNYTFAIAQFSQEVIS